jgi:hypothetical protein
MAGLLGSKLTGPLKTGQRLFVFTVPEVSTSKIHVVVSCSNRGHRVGQVQVFGLAQNGRPITELDCRGDGVDTRVSGSEGKLVPTAVVVVSGSAGELAGFAHVGCDDTTPST